MRENTHSALVYCSRYRASVRGQEVVAREPWRGYHAICRPQLSVALALCASVLQHARPRAHATACLRRALDKFQPKG